jgi:hypothetical protein
MRPAMCANPHLRVVGKLQDQPTRDLLRRPTQPELRFDGLPQTRTLGELGDLRSAHVADRRSIRSTRPIDRAAAVTGHLPRHRRWSSGEPASDDTQRLTRRQTTRDLLPLSPTQPQRRPYRLPVPAVASAASPPGGSRTEISAPSEGAARTAHPPRRAPHSVPAPEPTIAPQALLDLTDSIEAHVAFHRLRPAGLSHAEGRLPWPVDHFQLDTADLLADFRPPRSAVAAIPRPWPGSGSLPTEVEVSASSVAMTLALTASITTTTMSTTATRSCPDWLFSRARSGPHTAAIGESPHRGQDLVRSTRCPRPRDPDPESNVISRRTMIAT